MRSRFPGWVIGLSKTKPLALARILYLSAEFTLKIYSLQRQGLQRKLRRSCSNERYDEANRASGSAPEGISTARRSAAATRLRWCAEVAI